MAKCEHINIQGRRRGQTCDILTTKKNTDGKYYCGSHRRYHLHKTVDPVSENEQVKPQTPKTEPNNTEDNKPVKKHIMSLDSTDEIPTNEQTEEETIDQLLDDIKNKDMGEAKILPQQHVQPTNLREKEYKTETEDDNNIMGLMKKLLNKLTNYIGNNEQAEISDPLFRIPVK